MTEPNPFSSASAYDHIINPKLVLGTTGYQVGVDIANIDYSVLQQESQEIYFVDCFAM